MNGNLKVGLWLAVVVLVGIGLFFYLTRPPALPKEDIRSVAEELGQLNGTGTSTILYRISQFESKAQFTAKEILNGAPFSPVGVTNQIAGDIELDIDHPSASRVGLIRIDALTLKTDEPKRDGAIARFILKSENPENQYIELRTTELRNMPEKIIEGTEARFELAGDLTISGVTRPAVFKGTFKVQSGGKLLGTAETTVKRSDYNLQIPSVPFVASVDDIVTLKATIVAEKVSR